MRTANGSNRPFPKKRIKLTPSGHYHVETMGPANLNKVVEVLLRENASDKDLLNRYVQERDEVAFEAIVRRHGPMVWSMCRRVLRDSHDAEDAFQATSLISPRSSHPRSDGDSCAVTVDPARVNEQLDHRSYSSASANRRRGFSFSRGPLLRSNPRDMCRLL